MRDLWMDWMDWMDWMGGFEMARGYQLEVLPACVKWQMAVCSSVTDACQTGCEFGAGFLRLQKIGF
jgi:hypothetical protein